MESSNDSVAYRDFKNLVDIFKAQELEKYRLEHPEEKEAIPKSIVLNCKSSASASTKLSDNFSSSDEVKVVNKGNLLSFFQILFCGEGSEDEIISAQMIDEAMEIIGSSEPIAEQSRLTVNNITAKVDEIGT